MELISSGVNGQKLSEFILYTVGNNARHRWNSAMILDLKCSLLERISYQEQKI